MLLLFIILAFMNFSINVFYFFNGIIPLLWFPYVAYKVIVGHYKPASLLKCFISPIVWNVIFFIIGFLLLKVTFIANILVAFDRHPLSRLSCYAAIIAVFLTMFSPQAREEFTRGMQKED